MRVIGLMLLMILSFSLQFTFAQSSQIYVETDKSSYSQGDSIQISGQVNEHLFGSEVNLMIVSPSGDVVLLDELSVNNKKFETNLKVKDGLLTSSGDYIVYARYGFDYGSTQMTINNKQPSSFLGSSDSKKNILLNFDFVKSNKNEIQEHVDYKITISKNGVNVFGPSMITHSSTGSVSLPLVINERQSYDVLIEVYGILFQQSSLQNVSFSIMSGSKTIQSDSTSNNALKINLAIDKDPSPEPKIIPGWIKNNAKWWALGQIDDETFTHGVEYLIQNKIVDIPDLPYPASWMDKSVPSWVKNNASWWADDLIQEDDFIKGIKFLVEKGVIQIDNV